MVQKRPLNGDPNLELPLKNSRYQNVEDDHDESKLASFSDSVIPAESDASNKPHLSGGIDQESAESSEALQDVIAVPSRVCPGAEDLDPDNPIRRRARLIDIYEFFLEHLPLKSVPTGPNHQADIPEQSTNDNNCESEPVSGLHRQEETLFSGTCILEMPDLDADDIDDLGKGRTDCRCGDMGSVRCVKQHIVEAREKLKESFGKERFRQLGLDKMGESVNQTWSQLEEQLFISVVVSNPKTDGKNFWQRLRWIWPLRPKQDLVSYYFNVYMLQRRAQQNRFPRLNNDSDDDVWPWEAYRNEIEMVDTDAESGSESPGTPVCQSPGTPEN